MQPPGIELPAFSGIDFLVAAKGDRTLAQRQIQALVDRESVSPADRPRTSSPSRRFRHAALKPDTMTQIETTELRRWLDLASGPQSARLVREIERDSWRVERVLTQRRTWLDSATLQRCTEIQARPWLSDFPNLPDLSDLSDPSCVALQGPEWAQTLANLPAPEMPRLYVNPTPVRGFLGLLAMLSGIVAALAWTVLAPAITAHRVATEREAGTLPNLRMTGLSPLALALGVSVGGNGIALGLGAIFAGLGTVLAAVLGAPGLGVMTLLSLLAGLVVGCSLGLCAGLFGGRRLNPSVTAVGLALATVLSALCAFPLVHEGVFTAVLFGPLAMASAGLWAGPAWEVLRAAHVDAVPTATTWLSLTYLAVLVPALTGVAWRRRLEQPYLAPLPLRARWALVTVPLLGALNLFADVIADASRDFSRMSADDALALALSVSAAVAISLPPVLRWTTPRRGTPDGLALRSGALAAFRWAHLLTASVFVTVLALAHLGLGPDVGSPDAWGLGTVADKLMDGMATAPLVFLSVLAIVELSWCTGLVPLRLPARRALVRGFLFALGLCHVLMMPLVSTHDGNGAVLGVLALLWLGTLTALLFVLRRRDPSTSAIDEDDDEDDDYGEPPERLLH